VRAVTIEEYAPIVIKRLCLLLEAGQDVADAIRRNAPESEINTLRHEAFEALARLCEVSPQNIRAGLRPEFQRELDRVLAEAE
jgi:hypothetical protein